MTESASLEDAVVSDIQALTAEITRLESTVDFWNWLRIVATALTVILGAVTLLAQHLALVRTKTVSALKTELSKAKDRQLQVALAERDIKIGEANRAAGDANRSAAEIRERANRLEKEAAQQRERAAVAERTLLELKERTKPRALTADQRDILIGALRNTVRGRVEIACISGDSEGQALAEQIGDAFRQAGWPVAGVGNVFFDEPKPKGIFLRVKSRAAVPAHTAGLQHAFATAGLNVPVAESPNMPHNQDTVEVLVGTKY